jgi:UDP-N-acetylmuramate dehydrogenase
VVVGSMSNLIIPDEGYDGVVLHNYTKEFTRLDDERVYVSSGWRMAPLGQKLITLGLGGMEAFMSLPGTVGGAIYNNAHFQNLLFANLIDAVRVYDPLKDQVWDLPAPEAEFAYDDSVFHRVDWVILGIVLHLSPTDQAEAQAKAREASVWRVNNQPLNVPSAGCIFQNIPNDAHLRALFPEFSERDFFPTGFLIDKSGLKGKKIGGAQVSEKHAAFIVNVGHATAADVIELIELIKKEIKNKFQVELTEEVCFLR